MKCVTNVNGTLVYSVVFLNRNMTKLGADLTRMISASVVSAEGVKEHNITDGNTNLLPKT